MTQDLKASYVVAVAEQISFVSAFLGGVSATILFSVIVFSSEKRSVTLVIAASTLSACSLLIAVVSGWRLIVEMHPDLPFTPDPKRLDLLWNLLIGGYSLGLTSLVTSIGLSGWMRSRRLGVVTSCISFVAIVIFASTSIYR